jgi:hypothetical protein
VATAAPLDLSGWAALTLTFPGGQPAGSWVLDSENTAVTQVVNADPSFFLNNANQTSYTIQGTWQVQTSSDDDYMGFVFGYQNSSNFYIFDWKQLSQTYVGTNAAEGMTIKRFTGATGDGLVDLSLEEFWENETDLGDMTVLATNHSSTAGWVDNVVYTFQLDFNLVPGQFRVRVSEGTELLWDATIDDATFTSGQFGFYNNSQQSVRYAGFEQEVVPEPSALALLGLGALLSISSRVCPRNSRAARA